MIFKICVLLGFIFAWIAEINAAINPKAARVFMWSAWLLAAIVWFATNHG